MYLTVSCRTPLSQTLGSARLPPLANQLPCSIGWFPKTTAHFFWLEYLEAYRGILVLQIGQSAISHDFTPLDSRKPSWTGLKRTLTSRFRQHVCQIFIPNCLRKPSQNYRDSVILELIACDDLMCTSRNTGGGFGGSSHIPSPTFYLSPLLDGMPVTWASQDYRCLWGWGPETRAGHKPGSACSYARLKSRSLTRTSPPILHVHAGVQAELLVLRSGCEDAS